MGRRATDDLSLVVDDLTAPDVAGHGDEPLDDRARRLLQPDQAHPHLDRLLLERSVGDPGLLEAAYRRREKRDPDATGDQTRDGLYQVGLLHDLRHHASAPALFDDGVAQTGTAVAGD